MATHHAGTEEALFAQFMDDAVDGHGHAITFDEFSRIPPATYDFSQSTGAKTSSGTG